MLRQPPTAPASSLPPERRGPVVGRFCHGCHEVYPRFARRHAGKPSFGRDHIASPCAHHGQPFEDEAPWWEPAVEVIEAPPAVANAPAS